MSINTFEGSARDDARRTAILKAHLSAGQWKSEAWAVTDSLSWALQYIASTGQPGAAADENSVAEYHLAQHRLKTARKALQDSNA